MDKASERCCVWRWWWRRRSPSLDPRSPRRRRAQFVYERGQGAGVCPDGEAIQSGVAARLGYDPFDTHAERRIVATVQRDGRALAARVQAFDAGGKLEAERRLVARRGDCTELAASIELAITIAIDPFQASARRLPEPVAPSSTPPDGPVSVSGGAW